MEFYIFAASIGFPDRQEKKGYLVIYILHRVRVGKKWIHYLAEAELKDQNDLV